MVSQKERKESVVFQPSNLRGRWPVRFREGKTGSTTRTNRYMGKINPKNWQVLTLGDGFGFLLLFQGCFFGDYGRPCFQLYDSVRFLLNLHGQRRPIFFSRHGQSEYNRLKKIGGSVFPWSVELTYPGLRIQTPPDRLGLMVETSHPPK